MFNVSMPAFLILRGSTVEKKGVCVSQNLYQNLIKACILAGQEREMSIQQTPWTGQKSSTWGLPCQAGMLMKTMRTKASFSQPEASGFGGLQMGLIVNWNPSLTIRGTQGPAKGSDGPAAGAYSEVRGGWWGDRPLIKENGSKIAVLSRHKSKINLQRARGRNHPNPSGATAPQVQATDITRNGAQSCAVWDFLMYLLHIVPLWSSASACSVSAIVKVPEIWKLCRWVSTWLTWCAWLHFRAGESSNSKRKVGCKRPTLLPIPRLLPLLRTVISLKTLRIWSPLMQAICGEIQLLSTHISASVTRPDCVPLFQ